MLNIPLFSDNSTASVRKPTVEIGFGGGAASGGLAGAVSGALGAGTEAADPWHQHLVSLTVQAGLAPAVDVAELLVAPGAQAPTVALGDEGTIALGYADGSTDLVFTGTVNSIQHAIAGATRILVTNGGAALARLRLLQAYEQQRAADVVTELATQVDVSVEAAAAGVDLPFYVVDDGRSAYRDIAHLAQRSGYLSYFTPEGMLIFGPYAAGEPAATFTYGENIVTLHLTEAEPITEQLTMVGAGAAGSQGADAWSWLIKDPAAVMHTAGAGARTRTRQDAALHSGDSVQSAAAGILEGAGRANLSGTLTAPGAASVTVGSTIEITGTPQAIHNARFLVQGLRHTYTKQAGFQTTIAFSQGEGSSGGLGDLLGGLL